MGQGGKRPATYEDLLALPEDVVGQIIDGELIAPPRPANPHAKGSSALGGELYGLFQRGRGGPAGWWLIDEPEPHEEDTLSLPPGAEAPRPAGEHPALFP